MSPWDHVAESPHSLLSRRRILYKLLYANLQQANLLLENYPCPRLARVPRLSKRLLGRCLRISGILIYAILSRFPPYVGQLAAKTRRKRTPLRRLIEHA